MAQDKAKEALERKELAFFLANRARKLVPIRREDFDRAFDGPILDERGRCYFACVLLPPRGQRTRWSVRCRGADLWNRELVRNFASEETARNTFDGINAWTTRKRLLNMGFKNE